MSQHNESNPVQQRIYRLRGQQVILGPDLASLYEIPVRVLNQAVKRNMDRFPIDFMFQVSWTELEKLRKDLPAPGATSTIRSQSVILAREAHATFRPMAFTEEGVAMVATVLRSPKAVRVSIAIMRAFVRLRHALTIRRDLAAKVERIEGRVNLLETDVRLIREDISEKSPRSPLKPLPRIKGFEA